MTGLDRIEATARVAAEAVSSEIWHLDTGRATGVYTEARPSPTSEDVASAYHREVESHIATMDPSTTLALVARVREAEARLAEVDELHFAEYDDGPNVCFDDRADWPCPTHLAIHPECADECQHAGGAE